MINELRSWIRSDRSVIVKNTFRVVGAYGIIQVFAQDIGIPSGTLQSKIVQNIFIQMILFTSVAYSVTDDFFQSLSGTLIYVILKYIISNEKLKTFKTNSSKST